MGLINQDIFICLDCESTGLDPESDRLIEVAARRFTFDKVLEEFEQLVDPQCPIPPLSQEIHKISSEMLQGKPKVQEILSGFFKMVKGHIIMGHGIGFDIALLSAEARRHGIPTTIHKQPFIDTLRMARLYGQSPINSLDKLRQHFNIEAEGAHRALSDVIVNIEVFKHLAKDFKTTEALMKTLQKPIKLKAMPLGKHKGRRFDEIPIEYLLWAERKDFDQDLLYSLRSELRNRKRGGGFEQSGNPFTKL